MKFRKRRKYNTNAGDVETSASIFNSSVSPNIGAMGEDIDSYDRLADKEKLFNEIKKINPKANRKNYDKKSVRQMLAILNNYKDNQKRLTDKPIIKPYKRKNDRDYSYDDIYEDEYSGDYMIKGLQIGFETEKEAEEYIKELNSDEERN